MDVSTDRALRCATAVGCAVPRVLIELPMRDGKVARISHDPAFSATMTPCLLRRALVASERPAWLREAAGVELRGPFVDVEPQIPPGIVSFYEGATANATFATTAPPCLIAAWLHSAHPPMIDTALIDGRISVDTALGTTLVWLQSSALDPTQLVGVAQWIIHNAPLGSDP